MPWANVALAVLPSLGLALLIRERLGARGGVLQAFGAGFVCVLVALPLESALNARALGLSGLGERVFSAFVTAALTEEGLKLAALNLLQPRYALQRAGRAGRICRLGAVLGAGFACLESLFHAPAAWPVMLLRGGTAMPLQASTGFFLGLALRHERPIPARSWLSPLAAAVLVHGLYNFLAFFAAPGVALSLVLAASSSAAAAFLGSRQDIPHSRGASRRSG